MKKKPEHIAYQRDYFNQSVDFFRQPIPEDIQARTRDIVQTSLSGIQKTRILDVGTGIGVLLGHIKSVGVGPELLTGCDLSSEMLSEARKRHPDVHFVECDVDLLPPELGPFDAIFFNACFVNMFNQFTTVSKLVPRLAAPQDGKGGGRIIISHPMGRSFTEELKVQTPDLVAKSLPTEAELLEWCKQLPLQVRVYRDEAKLYLAVLERVTGGKGTHLES